METWSSTQQVIALSSAEAELYSLGKGAAHALFHKHAMKEIGVEIEAEIGCDNNAAIGAAQRRGAGKMRHVQTRFLWMQDQIASGAVKLVKEGTHTNPADVGTKHVPAQTLEKHLATLNFFRSATRWPTEQDENEGVNAIWTSAAPMCACPPHARRSWCRASWGPRWEHWPWASVDCVQGRAATGPRASRRSRRRLWTRRARPSSVSSTDPLEVNLDDLTVYELKAALKNRGLRMSGRKTEMIQRLRR